MKLNTKLSQFCVLSFGHHLQTNQAEGFPYLQARNFSDSGDYLYNVENYVSKDEGKHSLVLSQDDILLVSKGMRFFAYKYESTIGEAIASSIFYVIKVDANIIVPDYLTCILNHPKSRSYFENISAGSSIPSIRKKELLDFEVPLPTLAGQRKIVEIYQLHKLQMTILTELTERKQTLFNQIINELTENK